MQCWYDGRESTEEAIGPLFRSFVALRAPELNSSHREKIFVWRSRDFLRWIHQNFSKTSLIPLTNQTLRSFSVSSQFNFAELYVSCSVQFVVSCCAVLNHFRRDGSPKEKSLCSDYPENVGQNRMRGIRSYNKVCKFLDSSKTHALRRQHEPVVLVNERIHGRAPAVCSYSIRIFQVHAMVVHAMNTLEFYSFGVKITLFQDKRIHAQIAYTLNS